MVFTIADQSLIREHAAEAASGLQKGPAK